jgi:hypothetical protein
MEGDWIKVYRVLLEKPIWLSSTPEQKVILITLLLMANYRENSWLWNGSKYECKPGEFITSVKSIIEKAGLGVTRQNVRTALDKFEKLEFLTKEVTNISTKITILNWELYQSKKNEVNQPSNQLLTNDQPTANQQLTTKKEYKKERNKEYKNNNNLIIPLNLFNNEFKPLIERFIQYRKDIKKPLKSPQSIELFIKNLEKFSGGNIEKATEIINYSISNGYQGIFELKENPAATGLNKKSINQKIYSNGPDPFSSSFN